MSTSYSRDPAIQAALDEITKGYFKYALMYYVKAGQTFNDSAVTYPFWAWSYVTDIDEVPTVGNAFLVQRQGHTDDNNERHSYELCLDDMLKVTAPGTTSPTDKCYIRPWR